MPLKDTFRLILSLRDVIIFGTAQLERNVMRLPIRMMKKWLGITLEAAAKPARFAWEQFKIFWFTIAVPWLKDLTPGKALKLLGIAFVSGVLFVAFLFFIFSFGLPTVESLKDYKPSPGTMILAEDGRVLGQIKIEKGIYVPLKRIPKYMVNALLATEDPRFFQHTGIDYRGILRAALKNIIAVRVAQGGSTITQQLTKVVFLSPERKFKRKIKEIILARRLEKELTKDEILELYLNKIYFGHGAYGVQMASKTYFGKNIWEVNQAEAALLAGLPKSPMAYSPYSDIDLTKLRQWHVLKRMVAEGYLTEEQSKKIYDQPLNLENLRPQEEIAPYIVDHVRKYIEKKYGPDKLYEGGLKVYYLHRPGNSAHRGHRAQRGAPRARQAAGLPRPHRFQAAQVHADPVGLAPRHGEARRVVQRPCARGRRLLDHGQGAAA